MERYEGHILIISIGLTVLMVGIFTAVSNSVVPSLLILGITVFTTIYSFSDLWIPGNPNSKRSMRFNNNMKLLCKLLSMPIAFIVMWFTMQAGHSEATISQATNTYTLIALGIFFMTIVGRVPNKPENENPEHENLEQINSDQKNLDQMNLEQENPEQMSKEVELLK